MGFTGIESGEKLKTFEPDCMGISQSPSFGQTGRMRVIDGQLRFDTTEPAESIKWTP